MSINGTRHLPNWPGVIDKLLTIHTVLPAIDRVCQLAKFGPINDLEYCVHPLQNHSLEVDTWIRNAKCQPEDQSFKVRLALLLHNPFISPVAKDLETNNNRGIIITRLLSTTTHT
jgi:hypothetical protein